MLRINVGIQTNIHADVFDPKWVSQSFINLIRKKLLSIAIKKSATIRVVSRDVQQEIRHRYPFCRVIYAPIPVMMTPPSAPRNNSIQEVKTIGWIGRIAEDRGIADFIELLSRLNFQMDNFMVIVAGAGPLKTYAEKQLKSFLGESRVKFLGHVSQKHLSEIYRDVDVLISCAKSESYGLSIREALIAGTPVWAMESIGARNLQREFGSNFVRLFNLSSLDEKLAQDFLSLTKTVVPQNISSRIIDSNKRYLNVLFDSWDSLLNFDEVDRKIENG